MTPLGCLSRLLFLLAATATQLRALPLANDRYALVLSADGALEVSAPGVGAWTFRPDFTVLIARADPQLGLRPAGITRVPYNVPTWRTEQSAAGPAGLGAVKRSAAQAGDGFDDRILAGDIAARTADVFASATAVPVSAVSWEKKGDVIHYAFPGAADFDLSATVALPGASAAAEPVLTFTLTPKSSAWFSVGYTGAPAVAVGEAEEFWQPFIWQEKRFPSHSFLTPAFECPLPAAFVRRGGVTLGVVVDADEFPFQPLPLLENSRFGVALRDRSGEARPMAFAPVLGGAGSRRAPGAPFTFKLRLYLGAGDTTMAYEDAARRLYGFRDYRRNAMASINETLDRMIDYGLRGYSWFVDELKGCAYSTDVPGAVKNVSSLNPLNLALVTDDPAIYEKRAYPIIEFMLSREKFLFSLDPRQKVQSPSRALKGPCAPVSELAALYGISNGASPVFRQQAEALLTRSRTLNLDEVSPGDTWQNNLRLYQATGEERFLVQARSGADAYLADRIARGAEDFAETGLFFWTAFAPKWIDLFELFEATRDRRYLEAARLGARRFAMFTWVAPGIPDADVTVNPGGKAPVYWYLQGKGHEPMHAPEERVAAWRLSEIGLTPESSGTMSGHRAIFMANHAPWMLRIAALTGDALLHDVARSAVVGRYRNFPGYHINTARTTIYERADYPLRPHTELSVNSFHYNHIWPHMSILIDYLVTDAFARSGGAIDFPSRFIEGYAYLQSKFYGDRVGRFYDYSDAMLWMPRRLLQAGSVELNYLAARGEGRLYLAFANQSRETVGTEIVLNPEVLPQIVGKTLQARRLDQGNTAPIQVQDGRFAVSVAPMGLVSLVIEGIAVAPKFQTKLLGGELAQAWRRDFAEVRFGLAQAMVLNFGPAAKTAFVFLQADDRQFKDVSLTYSLGGSESFTLTDTAYPFEFTVPLAAETNEFSFQLRGTTVEGRVIGSTPQRLHR